MPATVLSTKALGQIGSSQGINPQDRRVTYGYEVLISARDATGGDIAMASTAIPQPGQAGPGGTVVLRHSAKESNSSRTLWRVDVDCGFNSTVVGENIAPWDRKPIIDWDVAEYQWVLINDYAAAPVHVTNSAGEPFDPPVMTTKYNRIATFKSARKLSDLNIDSVQDLVGSVNLSSVSIRSRTHLAKTCLLRSATAREQIWSDGTAYYDLQYSIEIENEVPLEKIKVQNKGFYFLATADDKSTRKIRTVKDPTNPLRTYPATQPLFLNTNGTASDTETAPLEFVVHPSENWSPLKLT